MNITANTQLDRLTIPLMITALAIMVAAVWYASHSLTALIDVTSERAKAREGRLELERTLSLFKDIETGARGYVISGRESYLAPYLEARAALPRKLETLKRLISDTLPSQIVWSDVEDLMLQRIDLATQTIQERRTQGEQVIHEAALFDEGKRVMDLIRDRFARIDAQQGQRIAEITAAVEVQRYRANASFLAAGFLALGLLVQAIRLLMRERTRRLMFEAQLRDANAQLETRVQERTADLLAAKERIASFALEQDRAIEAERRRLSREVHDQIGQVFTAIKLIAGSLPQDAFPSGQEAALEQALEMGIVTSRRIAAELRPPLLDSLGFTAAVNHYARQFIEPADIHCDIDVADERLLDAEQTLALFRILQEAFTNILRHARAQHVEIVGRSVETAYFLSVADDGQGMPAAPPRLGALGLVGMQERAKMQGGECKLDARANGGTVVEIRFPLRKDAP